MDWTPARQKFIGIIAACAIIVLLVQLSNLKSDEEYKREKTGQDGNKALYVFIAFVIKAISLLDFGPPYTLAFITIANFCFILPAKGITS